MSFNFLVIVLGLSLFEIISSIDNAIINAHILGTMPKKYQRIFLVWGIFFAVFVIRGVLLLQTGAAPSAIESNLKAYLEPAKRTQIKGA